MFLGLAATCFAAVAVWGMHFVSMISVRLKPSPDVTWFLIVSFPEVAVC
jgi:NO-binding membrane sensor protein with MHYT domain